MALSKAQAEAVLHRDGPAMILAGPGSGKTTVITHRTKYLIDECGISPIHILVITFTKAAAAEMKERFLKMCGQKETKVRFGTFHSVFFEILKQAYHFTGKNIVSEDQKYSILKDIIQKLHMDTEDEKELLADLVREISIVKNEQIDLEHYYAVNVPDEVFRTVYREYMRRLQQDVLLDYDDLMTYTWHLLRERKDILDGWRGRYQYILVDEFQDINKLQYEIVKMLAAPCNNLFIVGDDDQSIYRFRGAQPTIMLNFPKEYPNTKTVLLNYNYRCPGSVIDAAGRLILQNKARFTKDLKKVKEQGSPVRTVVLRDQVQESLWIIRQIQNAMEQEGRTPGDFAILYRNNTDALVLSQKLLEYNIPFTMKDKIPNLFEHWVTKHIKAYLRLAMGKASRDDLLLIINKPKRYVGRECFSDRQASLKSIRKCYRDKYWVVERLNKLERDLKHLSSMDPYRAVEYICHDIGYESYLEEYAQYRHIKAEDLYELLDRLKESAQTFETQEEWFAFMEEYSKKMQEQKEKPKEQTLTLTTLHSSKGLEFPIVFIIDVNKGIIPSRKAQRTSDMEEERRMFYVGMTRASERLCLCVLKEKNGKSLKPSPFLKNIGDS